MRRYPGAVPVLLSEVHSRGPQIPVLLLPESDGTGGVLLRILYSGGVQSGVLSDRDAGIPDPGSTTEDREKVVPPAVYGGMCGGILIIFRPAATGYVRCGSAATAVFELDF